MDKKIEKTGKSKANKNTSEKTKVGKKYNYSEIRTKRTSPLYVLVQPETERKLEEVLLKLGCTKTFLIERLIEQEYENIYG